MWYSDNVNPGNLPKSYTFGNEKFTVDDANQYKGTLYNWLVSTAGRGVKSTHGGTIEDSICPKNWRLPIDGDVNVNKSWAKLLAYAGSSSNYPAWASALRSAPYSFARAGYYKASINGPTYASDGYWWTATAYVDDTRYMGINEALVATRDVGGRGYGFSIRCVSR